MRYVGPDYKYRIALPGQEGLFDPKNWTDAQIIEASTYNHQIFAYFDDGENPNVVANLLPLPLPSGDKHYTHYQNQVSNEWVVVHNLNKHPSVTVVDSAGTRWWATEIQKGTNIVILQFAFPFSGIAYCN